MPRTEKRPIPSGRISVLRALLFSIGMIFLGLILLANVEPLTALLGVFTVFFYNLIYTRLLKKHTVFAAVPGAIPGAAPALLGYSAAYPQLLNSEALYLFLIMFLWQMPHFWALAIRFSEDYKRGGFPVLPAELGTQRTFLHMGFYVAPYLLLAVGAPFFVEAHYLYYFFVLPFVVFTAYEFIRFCRSPESKAWLRFFLVINFSVLVFMLAPVLDKWIFYYEKIGRYAN